MFLKSICTLILIFMNSATGLAQEEPETLDLCNTPELKAELLNMFLIRSKPTTWIATKKENYKINKGFNIVVEAKKTLDASRLFFQRDEYNLDGVDVCPYKKGILLKHPKGDMQVRRRGDLLYTSVVKLKVLDSVFAFYLKPAELVED